MRIRLHAILALLTMVPLVRAADAPTTTTAVDQPGFHIDLPAGFRVRHTKAPASGPANVSMLLLANTDRAADPAARNVQVIVIQTATGDGGVAFVDKDLRSFATNAAKDSAAAMKSQKVPDLTPATLGGTKALRYTLTGSRGPRQITETTTIAIRDGKAWYVQYLADPADHERNLPAVETALRSFRWTDNKSNPTTSN